MEGTTKLSASAEGLIWQFWQEAVNSGLIAVFPEILRGFSFFGNRSCGVAPLDSGRKNVWKIGQTTVMLKKKISVSTHITCRHIKTHDGVKIPGSVFSFPGKPVHQEILIKSFP